MSETALIDCLSAMVAGETARAVDLMSAEITGPGEAFRWACAFAAVIGASVPNVGPGDQLVVEVDRIAGAPENGAFSEDEATAVAALIASASNRDYGGAAEVFSGLTADAQLSTLCTILRMAALAVVPRSRES